MFHVKSAGNCVNTHSHRPATARETALQILKRCGMRAPVQALLNEELQNVQLPAHEAALATELVYGYLRREITLRWVVGRQLTAPEKLPPVMRLQLELAAYELFYLERVPVHATVNTTVDAVRRRFGAGMGRVANGLLRSLARFIEHGEHFPAILDLLTQEEITDQMSRLEVVLGIPKWILQLWLNTCGEAMTRRLAVASGVTPTPCVRINRRRTDWRSLRASLCGQAYENNILAGDSHSQAVHGEAFAFAGVRFPCGRLPPAVKALFRSGALSFQGAGSQSVLTALFGENQSEDLFLSAGNEEPDILPARSPLPPTMDIDPMYRHGPLWDVCAGYGGKTLALLEMGLPIAVAGDINLTRLQGLKRDAGRLGHNCPPLVCASGTEPPFPLGCRPANILLDAPCSGLGTLARKPDLRRLRRPEHLLALVETQRKLLDACWHSLQEGGHLVYTTCTINSAENEGQIKAFLERHPKATPVRFWSSQPDWTGADLMYGAVIRK